MNQGQLPKVVLHDHLDGGLRPETVLELAQSSDYQALPAADAHQLEAWFRQPEGEGLEQYLTAFDHTLAVMQAEPALERVAYESGCDLADDGVEYAEVRFAPSLSTRGGLSLRAVVESVLAGLARAQGDLRIELRAIVAAMRQERDSVEVANVALACRDLGVVGFDIAGPEAGHPATDHAAAFRLAADGGLGITVHAGEAFGPASITAALDVGAQRIGHGVRIIEDCRLRDGEIVDLGPVAQRVHDNRLPLEVCPHSNLQTIGWAPEEHPVGMLHRAGFVVTISADNRLMSGVLPSDEFAYLIDAHDFGVDDLETVTLNGIDAAFCDADTRRSVRRRVVGGYNEARTKSISS